MIQLTWDEGDKFWVRPESIEYIRYRIGQHKGKAVVTACGGMHYVRETPEEIVAKIKEAENPVERQEEPEPGEGKYVGKGSKICRFWQRECRQVKDGMCTVGQCMSVNDCKYEMEETAKGKVEKEKPKEKSPLWCGSLETECKYNTEPGGCDFEALGKMSCKEAVAQTQKEQRQSKVVWLCEEWNQPCKNAKEGGSCKICPGTRDECNRAIDETKKGDMRPPATPEPGEGQDVTKV